VLANDHNPSPETAVGETFMRLFLASERRIYGYILSLVPNRADADDLFQETGAVLWRKFTEYQSGTDFAAWALRIARIEVLRHRQRFARGKVTFSGPLIEQLADDLEARREPADDRAEALELCLEKLTDRQREMLRLRYEQDAGTQAIADALGQSLTAIYKAMSRAHKALEDCSRRALGKGGES